MFYFDKIKGKKILKSTLVECAIFTTRESFIKTKEEEFFKKVEENKRDIIEYLGIKKIIMPAQRHTANVEVARFDKENYEEVDALIIKDRGFAIALNFADCTPILLYDDKKNIGAIAHGGWRGTAKMIAQKTVQKMVEMGCVAKDIKGVIGPCISKCCFETGEDVKELLYKTIGEVVPRGNADLKYVNKRQLEMAGVKNIDVAPYCTVCDNDLFFSYRKNNATTCRHSVVLKVDDNICPHELVTC